MSVANSDVRGVKKRSFSHRPSSSSQTDRRRGGRRLKKGGDKVTWSGINNKIIAPLVALCNLYVPKSLNFIYRWNQLL